MTELLDNKAFRIRTLKEIIKSLNDGVPPEEVESKLKELVRETDSTEIAAMEQELIADGMPVEEVQAMCDLHSQVLKEVIVDSKEQEIAPGHPVDTFKRENQAIINEVNSLRRLFSQINQDSEEKELKKLLISIRHLFNNLMDIEKHYRRKEQLVFSCLERHGVTGPAKVMWGKDDEVRELLKALNESLKVEEAKAEEWQIVVEAVAEPCLKAIEEMIYKEEKILLPMALDTLTEDEWAEVWIQSPEYGWCIIEPLEGYKPPETMETPPAAKIPRDHALTFPTGSLTFDQLLGMFSVLPVDITFVDAEDRVRYFSEGPERIFERSKAIIGRKVQHCHPPKSVDIVERIVSDFRSGRQNLAEFWITMGGKFIHIRYFAVRGENGEYLGTLEVTQDLTKLRALEGERRLLEYE